MAIWQTSSALRFRLFLTCPTPTTSVILSSIRLIANGLQQDNSDAQYSAFRNNVPGLLALGSLHLLSSFIHSRLSSSSSSASRSNFLAVLSVAVLVILHGTSAVKVLAILIANYRLCMLDKPGLVGKFWPGVLIVGNMLVLLMNERFGGYAFGSVHGVFAGLVSIRLVVARVLGWRGVETIG